MGKGKRHSSVRFLLVTRLGQGQSACGRGGVAGHNDLVCGHMRQYSTVHQNCCLYPRNSKMRRQVRRRSLCAQDQRYSIQRRQCIITPTCAGTGGGNPPTVPRWSPLWRRWQGVGGWRVLSTDTLFNCVELLNVLLSTYKRGAISGSLPLVLQVNGTRYTQANDLLYSSSNRLFGHTHLCTTVTVAS